MNHDGLIRALSVAIENKDEDELARLIAITQDWIRHGLNQWHLLQCLRARATVLGEKGDFSAALGDLLRICGECEAIVRETNIAWGYAAAEACLLAHRLERSSDAKEQGRSALSLLGTTLDPSVAYERVISILRDYADGQDSNGQ